MIILIGGEKGGTGKTTLATNLAAMRALSGKDVLLIDTDQQSSASYWAQDRDDAGIKPRISCMQKFGNALTAEVKDLEKRYEDIVIDAGGRESVELRAAMVVAHSIFIPIQPSQFDIWTLKRMNGLVQTCRTFNPGLIAKVIISRSSTNPSVTETNDARALISDFPCLTLADVYFRDRIAYRRAAKDGLAVIELKSKDPKAIDEINAIYREVFE